MNVASALALASLWALVGTATLEPETEVPDLRVAIRKLTRTAEPRAPESIPTRPGVYRRALKASDGVHIAAQNQLLPNFQLTASGISCRICHHKSGSAFAVQR